MEHLDLSPIVLCILENSNRLQLPSRLCSVNLQKHREIFKETVGSVIVPEILMVFPSVMKQHISYESSHERKPQKCVYSTVEKIVVRDQSNRRFTGHEMIPLNKVTEYIYSVLQYHCLVFYCNIVCVQYYYNEKNIMILSAAASLHFTFGLENTSGPQSSEGSKVKSIQPVLSICCCCDKVRQVTSCRGDKCAALSVSPDGRGLALSSAAADVGMFFHSSSSSWMRIRASLASCSKTQ